MSRRHSILLLLAAGAFTPTLMAQSTTGALTVAVKDTKGNPVPGARVELRTVNQSGSRSGTTDAGGVFRAPLLPPGAYSGTVSLDGYRTESLKATVPLGGSTTVDAVLQVEQEASATVEVVGTMSKVDKSEVQIKENYAQSQILELPTTDRGLTGITAFAPGVTTGSGGSPVINGAATYENKFLVDGTDINDNYFNTDDGIFIEDAIAETAVLQDNVSAEYGRFTGGVVNAITKTGTNDFTGTLRATMTNPAWDALLPYEDKSAVVSKLGTIYTLTTGGPIVKDRLWFFVAGRFRSTSETDFTVVPASYAFNSKRKDDRYEGNLAWQIDNSNRIQVTFTRRTIDDGPIAPLTDYTAGLDSLATRSDTFTLLSAVYNAVFGNNMDLSLAYSHKGHHISQGDFAGNGGTAFWQSPVFDVDTFNQFNNHYFSDVPEDRDNDDISAIFNLFFSAGGDHNLKVGYEHFTELDDGTNGQSPTGYDINALAHFPTGTPGPVTYDFDPAYAYLDDWTKAPGGRFHSTYDSAFVNDNWTFGPHFNASIGFRWERYGGSSSSGYLTPTYSSFVPRLGLNWDIKGDSAWQVSGTYAQYAGKMNAAVTTLGTTVGNPALYDYGYIGPSVTGVTAGPGATGFNRSDYDTVPFYVSDPSLNVRLDPNLKSPLTIEWTLGLTHKVNERTNWTLRYISRKYTRMFEDYVGDRGSVIEPLSGQPYSIVVWGNTTSENANRNYRSAQATWESSTDLWGGRLDYFGNFTYSTLKGNYESDGGNSPGGGTQIGSYTAIEPNGVAYGYLDNDETNHLKLNALWSRDFGINQLVLGATADYASGHPYSVSRSVVIQGPGPYADYPYSYTQYLDSQRGTARYPSTYLVNFSAQWNGKFSRANPLGYFVKLTLTNVFNHIERASYDTRYSPANGGPGDPWAQDPGYGTTENSPGYYIGNRQVQVDMGFKF
ncbi:MAG TPA: TonB-dependent receptor [Holophagaceae bacterium]|nr:TonB-dependent receptor [Holophagaceae bacterium]